MPESFLGQGISGPDFYIAAIGRSGSTILCNWLTRPPDRLVFIEPFFLRTSNPRLLRIQLADFGLPVDDRDWSRGDTVAAERFQRIMGPRLIGRRWAFKEVLCEEHFGVLDAFAPPRVVITVRDIADVALSFFEKHRLQNNLDRFDDAWVSDYCLRESSGILEYREVLARRGIPFHVLRYEDLIRSDAALREVADFVDWEGGGDIDSHMTQFDRGFEIERHGREVSGKARDRTERRLESGQLETADSIAEKCSGYQSAFGYA